MRSGCRRPNLHVLRRSHHVPTIEIQCALATSGPRFALPCVVVTLCPPVAIAVVEFCHSSGAVVYGLRWCPAAARPTPRLPVCARNLRWRTHSGTTQARALEHAGGSSPMRCEASERWCWIGGKERGKDENDDVGPASC
jgi:hypothetical protein